MKFVVPGMRVFWHDPAINDHEPAVRAKLLHTAHLVSDFEYNALDCSATICRGNTGVYWCELRPANQATKDMEKFFKNVCNTMAKTTTDLLEMDDIIAHVGENYKLVKRMRSRKKTPKEIASKLLATIDS